MYNFIRGGSKGRGDNYGGLDNYRIFGIFLRMGYGWFRNGCKEFDRDLRIYLSGFGNGYNVFGIVLSFFKKF